MFASLSRVFGKPGAAQPTLENAIGARRYDISWLRVLAVLLLFPFHTARVFDLGGAFYVQNDRLSAALTYFISYMEPWHMPLLFLLAGAASWFALGRRSGKQYLGERVKRLAVPFIFGLLVLIPPQSYLGLLGHSGSAPSYFQWFPNFFRLNGADMDGYFLGGHTWGHLWFIVHLLVYSLLALPVLLFLRRGAGRRVVGALARVASVPGAILFFALALVPATFVPQIAGGDPAFYIAIFLLGYLMVSDRRFERAIDRHKLVALVLGPLAYLPVAYFEVHGWPTIASWAQGPIETYLHIFVPWFFMVALLGYGRRFLTRPNRLVKYADTASYPVYVLHQTVIVALAFLVVRLQVGVAVKFAVIMLGSLAISVGIYELAVRRLSATRFLFGMKPLRRATSAAPAPSAGTSVAPRAGEAALARTLDTGGAV